MIVTIDINIFYNAIIRTKPEQELPYYETAEMGTHSTAEIGLTQKKY